MLTAEENELLTRVGPGTPMGELFRRFWLPIFLAQELPEADGPPIRTRILGEDLVAFRDTNGTVGIVGAFCPHRRAPLFFGRNEECGLRCVYHGWKFDASGACVDMPSEPAESNFKDKVSVKAYPTTELGGVVWVYMGPPDLRPSSPPRLGWTEPGLARRSAVKWFQECNWLQGVEGDIDTAHISYLHGRRPQPGDAPQAGGPPSRDGQPKLTALDTDYGMVYGGRRRTESGDFYWRVTQWMLPMYSSIPQGPGAQTGWIPVDDHHCIRYNFGWNPDPNAAVASPVQSFDPKIVQVPGEWGTFTFPDGGVIDTYLPAENKRNLYNRDLALMRGGHYTGIISIPNQDRAMTEGMSYVCDRSQEHLGTTDIAVIAARRRLLALVRDLQNGQEPYAASHPEIFKPRALGIVSNESDLQSLLTNHINEVQMAGLAWR